MTIKLTPTERQRYLDGTNKHLAYCCETSARQLSINTLLCGYSKDRETVKAFCCCTETDGNKSVHVILWK